MPAAVNPIESSAPRPPSPGDHLSPRNFNRLARYIHDRAGIKMPESKITMLEGRLRRRVHATGHHSIDAYCDHVFGDGNLEAESEHLINAVTTNKTDFYREPAHFDYLREHALPDLAGRGTTSIRAWSAACSTGPGSLYAGDGTRRFRDRPKRPRLWYSGHRSRHQCARHRAAGHLSGRAGCAGAGPFFERYVMRSRDRSRRDVRIVPELRSGIGFAQMNLMDDRYPVGDRMHLIFCRNVLIYFDKPTQRRVVSRLVDCLAAGGYLFLGHSESIAGFDLPLVQVANTVFKRG